MSAQYSCSIKLLMRLVGVHQTSADVETATIQEQMHLCAVVESILPLGRNMQEQTADHYIAQQDRGWVERDFESLRRNFRRLYGKAKPNGYNWQVPIHLRSVSWAQELQRKIELEGGATMG